MLDSKRHNRSFSERSSSRLAESSKARYKNIRIEPLQNKDDVKLFKSKRQRNSTDNTNKNFETKLTGEKGFTQRLLKLGSNQGLNKEDESSKHFMSPASKTSIGMLDKEQSNFGPISPISNNVFADKEAINVVKTLIQSKYDSKPQIFK